MKMDGRSYSLLPTKLERRKLYGWTEQRVTEPDGSLCRQAGLNSDGVTIVPQGCTKTGMLREDGQWMDHSELVALHSDGTRAELIPSSFDEEIDLCNRATVEDLLDCNITSVYQMTGDDALALAGKVGDDIYSFNFSYRSGYEPNEAFLLANGALVFIIVGNTGNFTMVGLDEQGTLDSADEEVCLEDEELDFSMM